MAEKVACDAFWIITDIMGGYDMNPMTMMKISGMVKEFQGRHTKVFPFFRDTANSIGIDSIIEMKITTAEGKVLQTNMKVTQEDLELIAQLKQMQQ